MTKRILLFAVAIIISHGRTANGQLNITSTGTHFTIDFDSTAGGINSGQYGGNGFKPAPGPGELDSDGITVTGMSDGSVTSGGTNTSGDFARGSSTGGVYTGGIYAFEVQTGDHALGIQPGGSDFTPGDVILLIENNTGSAVASVDLSYEIWEYNDQDRANSFNFSYSTDNLNYTAVPALDFTSTEVAAGSPAWMIHNRSTVMNVSLNNGDTLYLKWSSDDVSGSGSRDEFALDDIVINFPSVTYTFNSGWSPSDPSGISTASDNIIVEAGNAALSSATTAGQVVVKPGATFDLQGNTLTVNGKAYLKADASGYSQVLGQVTGEAEWESYISTANSSRWFNIGVPLNATLNDLSFTNGAFIQTMAETGGNANQVNIYTYDPNTLNGTTGEGTWVPVTSKSAQTEKNGYSVYLGSPNFGALPTVITATGNLLSGNLTTSVSPSNGGWNFIANPYPSTLDWAGVVDDNPGLNVNYYMFDDGVDSVYRGYNATAGSPSGMNGATQYIAPGQAFFVQAGAASQVNFNNAQRTVSQAPSLYKKALADGVFLICKAHGSDQQDYAFAGFVKDAVNGINPTLDGKKLNNFGKTTPNISITSGNEDFMYKFFNPYFNSLHIPVSFDLGKEDSVVIASECRNIDESWSVLLEDKLTATFTDLKNDEYTFYHVTGNQPDRFVLHIGQVAVSVKVLGTSGIYSYVSEGFLTTRFGDFQDEQLHLSISDPRGRRMVSEEVKGAAVHKVDLNNLPHGLYIVQVVTGEKVIHTQKIAY